jgi:hypothetical protein
VATRAGSGDGRHSRSKLREKEHRRWERENESRRGSDSSIGSGGGNKKKVVEVDDGAVTVNFKNAGKEVRGLGRKIQRAHKKAVKKLTKKVDAAVSGLKDSGVSSKTSFSTAASARLRPARTGAGAGYAGYGPTPPWIGGVLGWGALLFAAWALTKAFGLGGGDGSGGPFRLPSFGTGTGTGGRRPRGAGPGRWVTDRSLGGREVWVEDAFAGRGPGFRGNALADDLTLVDPTRSEAAAQAKAKEEMRQKVARKRASEMLEPSWWARPIPGYCPPSMKEDRMRAARARLAALSAKRVGGLEYTAADLAELREACAFACGSVADRVKPESAKIGLFKAGVEFAVDACASRSGAGTIGEPREFLSGLSEDLGVAPGKAGKYVAAAVAARLRTVLLQATAQKRAGEEGVAMFTLDGAIGFLSAFPPEPNAPEMEMVAAGLKATAGLTQSEREWLSETFKKIGGGEVADAVDEALDVARR